MIKQVPFNSTSYSLPRKYPMKISIHFLRINKFDNFARYSIVVVLIVLEINPKVKNKILEQFKWIETSVYFSLSRFLTYIFTYVGRNKKQNNKCIFNRLIISNGINLTYCYTPWVNVLITQRVKISWRVHGIRPRARWTNLFLLFWSPKNKL